MFGLNPYGLALKAGVVLLCLVGGFWSGWKVASDHFAAGQLAAEREASQRLLAENLRANDIAQQLETEKAKQHVVYRTVTKAVDRVVDRPVYRNVCLDADGLRLANSALAGQAVDSGGADAAVPPARPADGGNRGGGAAEAR